MSSLIFLDTNVLLYASLQPDPRSEAARVLLARRGVISVQVLNEFANVARRKLHRTRPEITTASLPSTCSARRRCRSPWPFLEIAARTGYQLYDALIVAAALEAGCTTLFSEDLRDGQVINGKLAIGNPFKSDRIAQLVVDQPKILTATEPDTASPLLPGSD